jgi:hypothetical protein
LKPHLCSNCGRRFSTEQGLADHTRDKHENPYAGVPKAVRKELLDDIGDDLPDGAYFALAEEMGLEVEDLIDD